MPLTASNSGKTLTIAIEGTLNATLQKEFKACYKDVTNQMEEFVLDFSKVEFADSSGLGLLLILHGTTRASPLKPKLKITNTKPNIAEILKISRFDQHFEIS
ncbi:MAG: STAS domain-containing protein [Methylococcales bacterium]|jgi:anti-anti-sigma factor|nr:STAS domain-containing protein [Methylococcales bacterium]MBT7443095.1 STAS domain-containing protein [Methylococcales bacterium]